EAAAAILLLLLGWCCPVMLIPTEAVGKYCERAWRTIARAAMKFAKAAATFWLEILICCSRVFNCGSPKISHHLPCSVASCGCASFQPSICFRSSGVTSLNVAGTGADGAGRLYFGPTSQPCSSNTPQMSVAELRIQVFDCIAIPTSLGIERLWSRMPRCLRVA